MKEFEAHAEQAKVEQKRIDYEERRKTAAVSVVDSDDFYGHLSEQFDVVPF